MAYEQELRERSLLGAAQIPSLRVFVVTDIATLENKTPSFAVRLDGHSPRDAAARLGEQGICLWHGHYYAAAVMERPGLLDQGGLVRIGFIHYNTSGEVDGVLSALDAMAA